MDPSDKKMRYTIIIVIIELCNRICYSYETRCPIQSEWNSKGIHKCDNVLEYFCLLNDNFKNYTEFCKRNPDITRDVIWKKGHKCVIRGNLDGEMCSTERYQPFIFRTDGNSDCVYKKSLCQDEGMIIYKNGSTTSNTQCRCDHTKGFDFVSKTKHSCYCMPSKEDCSCYKKNCKSNFQLSSDYKCISNYSPEVQTGCPEFDNRPSNDSQKQQTDFSHENDMMPKHILSIAVQKRGDAARKLAGLSGVCAVIIYCCFLTAMHMMKCRRSSSSKTEMPDENNENIPNNIQGLSSSKPEIQNDYNDKIPEQIRDFYEIYVSGWIKDDKQFYVTLGTKKVDKMLKENNCVLVVGHSGNGKSAIIRHIALKHFNEDGYDIIPTGVAPTTILKYHNPERNQIFVIDDFCGKEVLNPQHVEIWSLHMDNILKLIINNQEHKEQTGKGNIKLLFATASDIFKDSLFIRMGCLSKFKFSLSEQPLQDQEKLCMIEKYVTQEKITDIITSSLKSHKDIYPLLCKLSVGKSQEQIVQLFTNPNEVIRQDFLELKNTNKTQICLIAICILLESLKDDMFREENIPVEDIEVIEAVCSEFDLDLCKESTRTELNEELKYLGKTYFVKVCESYQLMHQIIFDIAAVFCGKMMISNIFIRFAHSSYIAERYSFMSCDEEKIDNLIFIHNEEAQKIYFDRLLSDLKKGITYSTFHNRQLIHKLYRDKFCKYCRERKDEVVEILNNLKKNIKYSREDTNEKTTAISEENVNEYGDYMMFSKSYHFSSHKMRIPLIESVWEGNEDIVDLLVELKRNVNETDKFGRSALFVACQRGEENIAIYLLKKGAKHELAEHNEISPLIAACKGGYIRTMNALLNKGADIFKSDKNGCCSLHAASKGGHIKIVKQLLNAEIIVDINQDDIFGRSALFVASYHGKKRVVKFLIEKKARIDQCDKQGISPLLAACTQGRYDVVEILISSDADIFKTDTDRRSALHFACKDGQLTIVEKLLQIGADVKETDRQQRSPLFIASSFGHEQIVRHLVGKHFGLSIIKQSDEEGKSPLFIACEKGHESIVDILLDTTSSEIIEQTDKRQRTPLYVACSGGFLEIVKLLVHKGAQIDNVNICQATPLSTACKEGHIEVVQYLIQKHANLNLADSNGQTPLSVACDEGNAAVVRILVDHGSNIHHKDNDNRTPLQIAQMREHTDIENILKQ